MLRVPHAKTEQHEVHITPWNGMDPVAYLLSQFKKILTDLRLDSMQLLYLEQCTPISRLTFKPLSHCHNIAAILVALYHEC